MTDKQSGQQSQLPNQSPGGAEDKQKGYLSYKQFIDDLQALLIEKGMTKPDLAESLSIDINHLNRMLSITGFLKPKLPPKILRQRARRLRNGHYRNLNQDPTDRNQD